MTKYFVNEQILNALDKQLRDSAADDLPERFPAPARVDDELLEDLDGDLDEDELLRHLLFGSRRAPDR